MCGLFGVGKGMEIGTKIRMGRAYMGMGEFGNNSVEMGEISRGW